MKAFQFSDEPGLDGLKLVERPVPRPKAGEVLLRMSAWSLNYRDLLVAKGQYGPGPRKPIVPLSDGVGEVAEIGEGVTRVKVGDRVAGNFMQEYLHVPLLAAHSNSALGGAIDGMLAEFVVLHEQGVVHLPDHLSNVEAATLPCAAVTAWSALFDDEGLKPGQTVVVQGTGGVSIFALQFAKLAGARVIITSSSEEKLKRARGLGADETIHSRATPEWEKRVFELTDRVGADVVVEVGGAKTLNASLRAVRYGGRIAMIGVLTGLSAEVSTVHILQKAALIRGIYVGPRDAFEAMNQAIALHRMRPVVDRVFEFVQARAAFEYLESGAHFGKVAVRSSCPPTA